MHRVSRRFLNSSLAWNSGTPTMNLSPMRARPLQPAQGASSSSFAGFQLPPASGMPGSPNPALPSVTIRIVSFLFRCLARFSRPTQLESGVLEKTCSMLDEPEGRILRLQVQLATFHRHLSGRTIEFRYRKRPPSIWRLANRQDIHRAVLTVRGRVSGFSTVATVRLAKGVLSSLEFDLIPWTAHEPLEIEGKFADLVDSAPEGGTSNHAGEPDYAQS